MALEPQPVIATVGVRKQFGHVSALRGVDLQVYPGEVVALVGDNGAGKSTLMKIMCGAVAADRGQVMIRGEAVPEASVNAVAALGVGVVYQDLALAPHLSILENIFLGHERFKAGPLGRAGFLDRRSMAESASASLTGLGIELPSMFLPVGDLSGGQRQAVAIARAVKWATSVVLLDEPTAALGAKQTSIVADVVRRVASQGLGVLLVSHDMPQVLEIADRIIVLRLGTVAAEMDAREATIPDVVAVMLGHSFEKPEADDV